MALRQRIDRALAILLTLGYLYFLFSSVFSRRDWPDTIAYGLPFENNAGSDLLHRSRGPT